MRKDEFVPPVFAAGPSLGDPGFAEWLAGREMVKLPFTVWLDDLSQVKAAALGNVSEAPAKGLRLNDSALGVSLQDRLRSLAAKEKRIVVYLSGRYQNADTFLIAAVHEKADKTLHSYDTRGPNCLAIVSMKDLHCARGPGSCEKCKTAEAKPARPKLLDVCPYNAHVYARPTIELGAVRSVYDVLQAFETLEAAREFASKHKIEQVRL